MPCKLCSYSEPRALGSLPKDSQDVAQWLHPVVCRRDTLQDHELPDQFCNCNPSAELCLRRPVYLWKH